MSGLEPLAALGLVCNIVQLVEVGLKTARLCKNAYRTGEPDPELSVYAQNLAVTASSLTQSLEVSPQPLNIDDSRLVILARNCRDAEAEWRKKTPARFLSQQQPRKRDRFGAVFRGIVNKPEIDRLESQLQKTKDSLETDLLVGIFKSLDVSKVQANDLQDKFQDLLQSSSASQTKLHELIQRQLALVNMQISGRVGLAEASTKAHVTTELASQLSRLKSHADQGKDTILTEAETREKSRAENEAYERLLRSFRYQDMSHRKNEIHRRHESTFNWIFGENTPDTDQAPSKPEPGSLLKNLSSSSNEQRVCGGFVRWLKSPDSRYWISGRPGTGKSVLIKFIISDERTVDSLQQWQPNAQILTHFFWKVGSPMQSSFKGFLCSLVYQLLSLDKEHAIGCLQQDPNWSRKTAPGDWDNEDLQFLISSYLGRPAQPICLFVDGLDEFMDDDGVRKLVDFLDSLQMSSPLVKICMSSRPERAIRTRLSRDPDLKMQDLTRVDIQRYVRAILKKETALATSSICLEDLVIHITLRAKGVFLWAVLVTRSIARGISNGDSKEYVLQRLLKTPNRLHELYFDIWTRMGEDSDLYQGATALIFNIIHFVWQHLSLLAKVYRPLPILVPTISILELMLASSDDLWSTPLNHIDKLSATDLEQQCNELCSRLPVITADLFEVIHNTTPEIPGQTRSADKSRPPVLKYYNLKVQAIHRTVFDFLIETEHGKKIMGYLQTSQEDLFLRLFRSCLLRDCLWPELYLYVRPYKLRIEKEDRRWYEAGYRLNNHLNSLKRHADIIQGSALAHMLDLIWASFIETTKNLPSHPHPRLNSSVPRCKFDYLLRIAPMGFEAYVRENLIKWENTRQFDALHQVLTACLGSGGRSDTDFEWAGRQRLIEHILWIVVSADRFYLRLPKGLHLRNDTLVKASIACVLISAVDAFRISKRGNYFAAFWDADKTNAILRMIRDFRHLLCLGDHMLVTLYLNRRWRDPPDLISCSRHSDLETVVYVEISMSILVQLFLQQVGQNDAAFNRHEVEEALDLMAFPQTIKPIRLGVERGTFLIASVTDETIMKKHCQILLLPEFLDPGNRDFDAAKCYRERQPEAIRDIITRAEATSEIEEGIGPGGMNFYLCSSCEAIEKVE
ncbi:uncharacterized protein FRV6_10136 [Fusarium oxysporum]|uniref:Nephrocystin 3-like N-terminal domain-containing protein n=1 Tax=Fusarium oxysporum TaxID=5507 RepID=A0A2H3TVS3_FUSOX|nr:uncharacterized protein FRV6_10136 [Fusarium oxysporum]